jgi:hypothetical protein
VLNRKNYAVKTILISSVLTQGVRIDQESPHAKNYRRRSRR